MKWDSDIVLFLDIYHEAANVPGKMSVAFRSE